MVVDDLENFQPWTAVISTAKLSNMQVSKFIKICLLYTSDAADE